MLVSLLMLPSFMLPSLVPSIEPVPEPLVLVPSLPLPSLPLPPPQDVKDKEAAARAKNRTFFMV